jgi:hypothetical protein
MRLAEHVERMGEMKNSYNIERNIPLGRQMLRWKYTVK